MSTKKTGVSRRRFIAGVATTGLAANLPGSVRAAEGASSSVETTARDGADLLAAAEKLAGIRFTAAQRAGLVKTVAERIPGYVALRSPPLAYDVFPAITFQPALAGIQPPRGAITRLGASWKPKPPTPAPRREDLAFASVAELAALLRSGQVTSRELTELSLGRLKQHDRVLTAVVTLTEERALRQADAADAEIKSGKWRGPLHGIPWGAKDLLAVAGYPTTWGAAQF